MLAAAPDDARRLPHRVGDDRPRSTSCSRPAPSRCLTKDEDFDGIVAAVEAAARDMKLTAENTAIVLDSTADFPDAPERFPNFRVVPLYVRFGDESFRDYVEIGADEFYERLQTAAELPTTSQPTPGDFLAIYEELGELRADPLAADLLDALGHVRERRDGGRDARR